MEKNDAIKMMIGSTWKANNTPYGPLSMPSGPNRNAAPSWV